MKQKFNVTGMTCSACSAHVERDVNKVNGVTKATVNLLSNSMNVEYDETQTNAEAIIHAVTAAGYGASLEGQENGRTSDGAEKENGGKDYMKEHLAEMKKRMWVSFLFLIPLMYLAMHHMIPYPMPSIFHGTENALIFAFTQLLLTLPIMYVNRKYYEVGFKTLFKGSPNMDSLIAIGSSAAFLYGIMAIYFIGYGLGHGDTQLVTKYSMDLYFESAGMILALITMGKYLETRSKGKTSEAIGRLIHLSPKTAVVVRDGKEVTIPTEEVLQGDTVIVKSGQIIPVDGVVVEGQGFVDQSAITGESIPVEKQAGDSVTGATINQSGYFRFQATKVGKDTTLSQIIALVEEAGNSKAPIAKLADKVSGVFVPIVISIAVLVLIGWLLAGATAEFALSTAIAVLVISCPCALGLATPVAIMVGTGKGAEYGILIKSAESLETAHKIDTVVLDKTGTITEGRPSVSDVRLGEGISEETFLKIAGTMEAASEHPLSKAVLAYCEKKGIIVHKPENYSMLAGFGIRVEMNGKAYIAGNRKLMEEKKIPLDSVVSYAEQLAKEGKTPLYFAEESGMLLGMIAVVDQIKTSSVRAIERLKQMNIASIMLTGDNALTANAVKNQLALTEVISDVLPQDKERKIQELKAAGKTVAMIGDGINDAPALTSADVGMAIGAGTDIAIESADVVLLHDSLEDAVTAIELSKAVIGNIKMNLFWAFFYNIIGIPIAAGILYPLWGFKLSPMLGAAAMSLSSVCVVTNALRLRGFHPRKQKDDLNSKPVYEKKEGKEMEKTIKVNGMACGHCTAAVEKALMQIEGVASAKADLEKKDVTVTLEKDIADEVLKAAITESGYEVPEL